MTDRPLTTAPEGDLETFTVAPFSHDGATHDVYRKGDGPAVIVITEMPGISPLVLGFADRVVALGCTAVVPDLFGTAGRDPTAGGRRQNTTYGMRSMAGACISREFTVFATGRTSRVIGWLRALAAHEHDRLGRAGRRCRRDVLHGRLRPGDGRRPARRGARALAAVAPASDHEGPQAARSTAARPSSTWSPAGARPRVSACSG